MINIKGCFAVILTAAALLGATASASDTAPLAAGVLGEKSEPGAVQLCPFGRERSYRGVSVSAEWVRQVRIGGLSLKMRLFTPQGDPVTFQQNVAEALSDPDGVCLALCASEWEDDLMLQFDQHALDVLVRAGITEIVVTDEQRYVRAVYQTDELNAVRKAFELGEREQLCLMGENNPVTVVSEEGVRRRVTE